MKQKSDADMCRENRWVPGDFVKGVHPTRRLFVVKITAIGMSEVLARRKGCAEGKGWEFTSSNAKKVDLGRYGADLK